MVVLVNHGTSGAAELVAAALLDDKRADLVGDKTFGDGSQQKTIELPDHAALILTVAQYERPSGKVIEDEGITPNVVVASNLETEADDDSESPEGQPTRAASSVTQPQTAPAAKPQPHVDDQLNKALELLKSKQV